MEKFGAEWSIPIKTQLTSNRLNFSVYTCTNNAIYALYGCVFIG